MKKQKFLFSSVATIALLLRFWQIGKLPPQIDESILTSRYTSALLSIGAAMLVYLLIKDIFNHKKLALLSYWIFAVLPWSVEQGRIYSQVNNALFFSLLILYLFCKIQGRFLRIFLLLTVPIGFYFIYPDFWLFRFNNSFPSFYDFLTNIIILASLDLLFFHNITFWWGGIKEFGIMYVSLLPFFLTGIYYFFTERRYSFFLWWGLILLIAATSPFFPESREFFFSVPLICLIAGYGLYKLSEMKIILKQIIIILLVTLITYEVSQYFHYYSVHYPQDINKNISQIHEAF